jgi:hypothetical protein
MTGFEVYKLYLSVKLHFTSDKYNFFQYNGKSKASQSTYDARKDKYFFEKLANKYNYDTLVEYFVSQFVTEQDMWLGDIVKPKGEKIYYNWRKKKQTLKDTFELELGKLLESIPTPYQENIDKLFHCTSGTHPLIVKAYLKKSISLESLIILEKVFSFVSHIDQHISDPLWKSIMKKIVKYSPFLDVDVSNYKKVIKGKITCQNF